MAHRDASAMAEPKVASGLSAVTTAGSTEEIFLSPRVIDRAAFESYSTRLRELLDSVTSQRTDLAAASMQASETHQALVQLGDQNKEHLDLATKLLRSLSQKTTDVESMLSRAEKTAEAAAKFEQEADRIIGARVSALEKRMAESLESFSRQLQSQMDARSREMSRSLEEMKAARESIKKQVDTNVVGSMTALREACERAELLVGRRVSPTKDAAPATPTAGSLGDLVRRASEAAERSQAALDGFTSISNQADGSVRRLTESLEGSMEFMDQMKEKKEALIGEVNGALSAVVEAQQRLSEKAAEAARIFKPISELRRNAEETAARLQTMVNQAETVHEGGACVAGELQELIERIETVAERIEPWRPLLLDSAGGAVQMPEPIADLIEQIRSEISADLSKMAAAMSFIAGKAMTQQSRRARVEPPEVVVHRQSDGTPAARQ